MILRVASGLSYGSSPEYRWRRMAVPVSAFIFMLLMLAGSSVVVMVQREAERVEQRTALMAARPSPNDLNIALGDDVWRGEQFLVVWIQPAGEGETVLPPGVSQLPEPGQAVVSPALDRLASKHPNLSERYHDRSIIGTDGIQSGGELLAYVRMPEDRKLSGDLSGDLSGLTQSLRVRAFGSPSSADVPIGLEPLSRTAYASEAAVGVLGFLAVPGFIVLVVGLTTASRVRDRRLEVMRWIGVDSRTLATIAVLETIMLALPGLVGAAIIWGLIAPRLEHIPLVGHEAVRGDLRLPWWLLLAGLGTAMVVIGFVAILTTVTTEVARRRTASGTRPSVRQTAITPLRAAPLGAAFVLLALGWPTRGSDGSMLNLLGTVAAIVGVPLVFPGVVRLIGNCIGRLESTSAWIAGRGLEWDPVRASRPFLGVGAVVVIALASSGYLALAHYIEGASLPIVETRAVSVEWLSPQVGDLEAFESKLGSGLVVPVREGGHHAHSGGEHEHNSTLVVGATCRELSTYLIGAECDADAPYVLSAEAERGLAETLAFSAHGPDTNIRLAPAGEVEDNGMALVLGNAPLKVLESRVRDAAMATLPAPYVNSWLASTGAASPLVTWLVGGLVFAVLILAIGCLLSLVDRILSTRDHRRLLLDLGVPRRQFIAFEAWQFAAPYSAVVGIGFCAGLIVCVMAIGILPDTAMPWNGIGLTLLVAILTGVIITASVALVGARVNGIYPTRKEFRPLVKQG